MIIQQKLDKLMKSLDEKIPVGMAIRSSKAGTMTPSRIGNPLSSPLANRALTGLSQSNTKPPQWFLLGNENLAYFGLSATSLLIWMTTVILMLMWLRYNELGY